MTPKFQSINSRRDAREFSFYFIYQQAFQEKKVIDSSFDRLDEFLSDLGIGKGAHYAFSKEIVSACAKNQDQIMKAVEAKLVGWRIDRIKKVDLALIMLGMTELKFITPPTPAAVVVDEYVEISKSYGDQDSPAFIHGILDKIHKDV